MIEVLRNPMGSPVASPDDVVQTLMNDGTIDAMRMKIITQLKANEELKKATLALVEQSKVLNSPGSEKQTKRELFDSLRQELEAEALEKASKVVWELILSKEGVGKEINETVEKVFCRLSGRDPPQFPSLDGENQQDKVNEENKLEKEEVKEQNELERGKVNEHNKFERKKRKEKNKLEEGEKKPKNKLNRVKESKNRVSSSKKRNFIEISAELEEDEVPPLTSKDSAPGSRTVTSGSGKGVEYYRRCLRTDGKNWQCRMEAVPDGKYCENHMYKRSRQKTPVKTTTPLVKKKKKTTTLPKERLENTASTRREVETISRVKRELSNELEITTRSKKKKLEMNTRVPTSNIDIKNDFNVAPAPPSCPMAAIVSAEAVPTSDVDSNSDFPRIPISDMDSTSNIPPLPMSNMESDSNIPPVSGPVSDIPKVSMSNISSNSNIPISTPPQGRTDGNKNDSDCDAVGRLGFSPKAAFVSAEHSSPESASIGAKESSALAVTSNVGVNHDIPIYTPPQGRIVNTTDKIDCDAAARLVFSAKAFVASVMDSSPVAAVMGPVGSSIRGTDSNLLVSTPSQDTNANNNNNNNNNANNNNAKANNNIDTINFHAALRLVSSAQAAIVSASVPSSKVSITSAEVSSSKTACEIANGSSLSAALESTDRRTESF